MRGIRQQQLSVVAAVVVVVVVVVVLLGCSEGVAGIRYTFSDCPYQYTCYLNNIIQSSMVPNITLPPGTTFPTSKVNSFNGSLLSFRSASRNLSLSTLSLFSLVSFLSLPTLMRVES